MALSAARNTPQMGQGIPQKMSYPQKGSTTIYEGSLVVIDSSGYAKPGVSEVSDRAIGRALMTQTNSGASGSVDIQVEQGVFSFAVHGSAATIASLGVLCYVYDDATVTLSSASASICGTIYGLSASDGTAVWVYIGLAPAVDGTSLAATDAALAQEIVDLAATTINKGADLVGLYDAASIITATTVGAALQEIEKQVYPQGTAPQALSGVGAANVTSLVTMFTSTGSAQAISLANGTYTGQLKVVHHTVDGGSGVLTPTTAGNFASFTLTAIHDACLLQWSGSVWNILLNVGGTVG